MKGKNLRLRFKKPIEVDGRVQFIAERKLNGGFVIGRYTLPKAEIRTNKDGKKYIHIDEGPIGALPNNQGVGSAFLRQTHGIFREIARRKGMDVLHVTTPANRRTRRFFEDQNNYKPYKAAESARLFRYRGGKPRERSENVENIIRHLLGDKDYWEARKRIRKK